MKKTIVVLTAIIMCLSVLACVKMPDLSALTQDPADVTEAPFAEQPTEAPTEAPTAAPTEEPTPEPTKEPTPEPTEEPTPEPTKEPQGTVCFSPAEEKNYYMLVNDPDWTVTNTDGDLRISCASVSNVGIMLTVTDVEMTASELVVDYAAAVFAASFKDGADDGEATFSDLHDERVNQYTGRALEGEFVLSGIPVTTKIVVWGIDTKIYLLCSIADANGAEMTNAVLQGMLDSFCTAEEFLAGSASPDASVSTGDAKYVNFDEMNFYVNGMKFTLGMTTLQEMIDAGVPFRADDLENAENNLQSGYESQDFEIELGEYAYATINVMNDTDSGKKCCDCFVSSIWYSFRTGGDQTILTFDFPMDLTIESLIANAGEPDEKDHYDGDNGYYSDTLEYKKPSSRYWGSSYYSFEFTKGEPAYIYMRYLP